MKKAADYDKRHIFKIYRYQLLPVDRYIQRLLFDEYQSMDDIIKNKNKIFQNIISTCSITDKGNTLKEKRLISEDDFILSRYAVKRHITIETEEFTEKELNTWPSFMVCFWNNPEKQYLLIEENKKSYQDCTTILNAIKHSFSSALTEKYLSLHIEPLFEEKDFWDTINRYQGCITSLKFEMITPNMANISYMLAEDLKEVAKLTNTITTNLEFNSDGNSALKIDDSNQTIQNLVSYSSKGGGNITLKARGVKQKIKTKKTVKTIKIDDIDINTDGTSLAKFIRSLLC